MISKEEYIKLYCDVATYKTTGAVIIDIEKVAKRMMSNPIKTLGDLNDYGFSSAMSQNGIEEVKLLNTRTGRTQVLPVSSEPVSSYTARHSDNYDAFDILNFNPDEFDWCGEDSIK